MVHAGIVLFLYTITGKLKDASLVEESPGAARLRAIDARKSQ